MEPTMNDDIYENFFADEKKHTGGAARRNRLDFDDLAEDEDYYYDEPENNDDEDALYGGRARVHPDSYYTSHNKYCLVESSYGGAKEGGRYESKTPHAAAAKIGSRVFRDANANGMASIRSIWVIVKSTHRGDQRYVKYYMYNLTRERVNKTVPKGNVTVTYKYKINVKAGELPEEYVALNKQESKLRAAKKRAEKRAANGEAPKPKKTAAKKPAAKKTAAKKASGEEKPKKKAAKKPAAKKAAAGEEKPKKKAAKKPAAKKAAGEEKPKKKAAAKKSPSAKKGPGRPKKTGGFFTFF
jgi:hypothetical protein